jgi:hypothetical protein
MGIPSIETRALSSSKTDGRNHSPPAKNRLDGQRTNAVPSNTSDDRAVLVCGRCGALLRVRSDGTPYCECEGTDDTDA